MTSENVKKRSRAAAGGESDAKRRRAAEFGVRLVQLRKAKGWSRAGLARRLGVSHQRIAHWERGEHLPPLDALLDLWQVLGIPLEELFTGEKGRAPGLGLSRDRQVRALQYAAELVKLLR
jgi:transcriptional regulator with XRE-family HTH domain